MPLDFLAHPCDAYTSTSTVLLTCTARPTAHSRVYYREEPPKLLVNGSGSRGGYGVVRGVRIKIEEEDLWCRHNWMNLEWKTCDGICG